MAWLAPWISEARQLMKVSTPLIIMQLTQFGVVTADIIMVGSLGEEALAATSIGAVMFYFAWLGGYGPVMAVSPIVSQILGAHPNDRARSRLGAPLQRSLSVVGLLQFACSCGSQDLALAGCWLHAEAHDALT